MLNCAAAILLSEAESPVSFVCLMTLPPRSGRSTVHFPASAPRLDAMPLNRKCPSYFGAKKVGIRVRKTIQNVSSVSIPWWRHSNGLSSFQFRFCCHRLRNVYVSRIGKGSYKSVWIARDHQTQINAPKEPDQAPYDYSSVDGNDCEIQQRHQWPKLQARCSDGRKILSAISKIPC